MFGCGAGCGASGLVLLSVVRLAGFPAGAAGGRWVSVVGAASLLAVAVVRLLAGGVLSAVGAGAVLLSCCCGAAGCVPVVPLLLLVVRWSVLRCWLLSGCPCVGLMTGRGCCWLSGCRGSFPCWLSVLLLLCGCRVCGGGVSAGAGAGGAAGGCFVRLDVPAVRLCFGAAVAAGCPAVSRC